MDPHEDSDSRDKLNSQNDNSDYEDLNRTERPKRKRRATRIKETETEKQIGENRSGSQWTCDDVLSMAKGWVVQTQLPLQTEETI